MQLQSWLKIKEFQNFSYYFFVGILLLAQVFFVISPCP